MEKIEYYINQMKNGPLKTLGKRFEAKMKPKNFAPRSISRKITKMGNIF